MGIAFLLVAAAISFSGGGGGSGLWLLIPAFLFLGKGIGDLFTVLNAERNARQIAPPPPVQSTSALPPRHSFDPVAPASVTEETTRHLDTSSKMDGDIK